MKKLLICCIYGVTAAALAKKMQAVANSRGYKMVISGAGIENFISVAPAFDAYLIAPHIQYKIKELTHDLPGERSVKIIDGYLYASINAEKILDYAIDTMPELTH